MARPPHVKSSLRSLLRLVVLSVDGMHPAFYRRPRDFGLKIPNILSLVKSGASADAVEGIYPSTTYPAHATLVTGVPANTSTPPKQQATALQGGLECS